MPVAEPMEENLPQSSVHLTFATLPSTYLPSRALFLSSVLHEIVIFAILFLATHNFAHSIHHRNPFSINQGERLIYLPVLGGGHEGSGHRGGGSGVTWRTSAQLPARSSKGLSYPGKQPFLSNPPNPLNFNQTLIQSGLKKLPILRKFVPLPNLVQSADATPPAPLDLRRNKTSKQPSPVAPIAPPKIALSGKAPQMVSNNSVLPTLHPSPPPEPPNLTLPILLQFVPLPSRV